jgi:hypothetical protein
MILTIIDHHISSTRSWMLDTGCWILDMMLDTWCRMPTLHIEG